MRKKKFGLPKDTAILRSMANKKAQTYATRRLLRDLKEIENNSIPTVGVTARPLPDNLFVWHANLRGPEGTPYQGGVFHAIMNFPTNYPHSPPNIQLSVPVPHPCVVGTTVNLDMFDTSRKGIYEGWTSGYSVLSILIQLQSFLFEVPTDLKAVRVQIREAVKKTNEFSILEVGHKGPLSPWPPFYNKENDPNSFVMLKTEKERIQEEMVCFHTKLNLSETPLGLGVSISRLPRTGEIRSVEPTMDLISLKAYMKEGVRRALDNTAFTHWIPLYFGQNKDQTLYLARKALSMICTGSTKRFEESHIMNVMPKLVLTLVLNMMEQKEHTSLKALRMLIYIHRLFLLLLEAHPSLYGQIHAILKNFVEKEEYRIKDNLSSLGDLLGMLTVSKEVTWKDIIGPYLKEQTERQVFWILKDIPELAKIDEETEMDEDRSIITFQSGIVGCHITLFFSYFISNVTSSSAKSGESLLQHLDSHFSRLPLGMEAGLQKQCEEIRRTNTYKDYFNVLGVPIPDEKALLKTLKEAVENSARKKYHGAEDEFSLLPERGEMVQEILKRHPSFLSLCKFQEKEHKGKKVKVPVFPDLPPADPKWRKLVLECFDWVREIFHRLPEQECPGPVELGNMADLRRMNLKRKDEMMLQKEKEMEGDMERLEKHTVYEDYSARFFGWRELMVKLEFEEFMDHFGNNPDFLKFYEYLEVIAPHLRSLCLMVVSKKHIKSGFHWLTALLSKLTHLKTLKLFTTGTGGLSPDAMKALFKGMNNFKEGGGSLEKFQVVKPNYSMEQKILYILKTIPQLIVIRFRNMNINTELAVALNRVLTEFKQIRELDLKNCGLQVTTGKEIADGLMRAKQLEVLKLSHNPMLSDAISLIVYNLAFSPRISYLDVSNLNLSGKGKDNAESVYKLLTISGSLETLLLHNTYLNGSFKTEFYKALGENRSLKVLTMDGTTIPNSADLGKALAMNARKNGSLEMISLKSCINSYYSLTNLINNLWISDYDHEMWYGDQIEAKKMHGDQLVKVFHCGIDQFVFGGASHASGYSPSSVKHANALRKYPIFARFMAERPIQFMNLSAANLVKSDGELIAASLSNPFGFSRLLGLNLAKNNLRKEGAKAIAMALGDERVLLQRLDLSGNKIGVSGTKSIAEALGKNEKLKILNLFSNIVDVDGARALREALLKNKTLEFLDIGLNRLRDKGAMAIAEGLARNKESGLRRLGLRLNFIRDDGLIEFFKKAILSTGTKLEHLYLQRNYQTEPTISFLHEKLKEKGIKLDVDFFHSIPKTMDTEKLNRSIWISPLWQQEGLENHIKEFFEDHVKVGVVMDVRLRTGPKLSKPKPNIYAIVEFAHPNSVPRALRVASKKKGVIQGNRIRIYKAGTRVQTLMKPPSRARPGGAVPPRRGGRRGGRRGRR